MFLLQSICFNPNTNTHKHTIRAPHHWLSIGGDEEDDRMSKRGQGRWGRSISAGEGGGGGLFRLRLNENHTKLNMSWMESSSRSSTAKSVGKPLRVPPEFLFSFSITSFRVVVMSVSYPSALGWSPYIRHTSIRVICVFATKQFEDSIFRRQGKHIEFEGNIW